MSAAAAEWVALADLQGWEKNPKIHGEGDLREIVRSLERFGFGAPLVVWKSRGQVVAGNGRLQAAQRIMQSRPDAVLSQDAPGPGLVPVRFMEFANEAEAAAYGLVDNRLTELNPMDDALVGALIGDLSLVDLPGFIVDLSSLESLGTEPTAPSSPSTPTSAQPTPTPPQGENIYTKKMKAPIYTPRGAKPEVGDLCEEGVVNKLLAEIEATPGLEPEVKAFLVAAAERHRRFHFQRIAEYYCHASPEIKRLFEHSALVIIDYNQAIELGFVKMTEKLAALVGDGEVEDAG